MCIHSKTNGLHRCKASSGEQTKGIYGTVPVASALCRAKRRSKWTVSRLIEGQFVPLFRRVVPEALLHTASMGKSRCFIASIFNQAQLWTQRQFVNTRKIKAAVCFLCANYIRLFLCVCAAHGKKNFKFKWCDFKNRHHRVNLNRCSVINKKRYLLPNWQIVNSFILTYTSAIFWQFIQQQLVGDIIILSVFKKCNNLYKYMVFMYLLRPSITT